MAVDSKRVVAAGVVAAAAAREMKGLDLLPRKPAGVDGSTADEVRRHRDGHWQRGSIVQGAVNRAEAVADGVRL